MSKRIYTVNRPYLLLAPSGTSYPLSSVEAQRLLDEYVAKRINRWRVELKNDGGERFTLVPATLASGPAFE